MREPNAARKPNGALIRARREELNLSTAEVAEVAGYAEGSLRNIENGTNYQTARRRMLAIGRRLGLTEDELYLADEQVPA